MNKDAAFALTLIAAGTAIVIASQARHIKNLERINEKIVMKNNVLYRTLERTYARLTEEQAAEINDELNVELDFGEIILNNM